MTTEMKFHVLTLFPHMVTGGLLTGVTGRAAEKKIISLNAVNIRDYTADKHGKVDDYPYGGGAGMLMQAQPVFDAWKSVTGGRNIRTIYVTPQGVPFTQKTARELSRERELVFLCGHYEGIDERVLEKVVTDSFSIGDYILTGGELPAMVMIDAIARLIPGVLGNQASPEEESFHNDLLEYPQYSRPEVWEGVPVPGVLLSGDHRKVEEWRLEQSEARTAARRPDLYGKYREKQQVIKMLSKEKRNNIHIMESLSSGKGEILYAKEDRLLVYDRASRLCMINARDLVSGEKLADMIPEETGLAVVSEEFLTEILQERGYRISSRCRQLLYTRKETLPVKYKDIRSVSIEYFPYICAHYHGEDAEWAEYVRERILAGDMYGAFAEGRPAGFIGIHSEGSLGMLFVEEAYRGRGIGASLEAFGVNRILEKGRTPFVYVEDRNELSLKLQEKLGFIQAKKTFFWLEKSACK